MATKRPVPALVSQLDSDHVPDRDFWPGGTPVGQVREPDVDCDYCYELLRRLNSALARERTTGDSQ